MVSQDVKEDVNGNVFVNLNDSAGSGISSTSNALNVFITGGSSTSSVADKTAFTYGTSLELTVGAVFQDTSPTVTAGSTNALRMNAQRGLHVNLRSSAGTELLGAQLTAVSIPVNIASDQVVPISATALPLPSGASTSALQTTGNTSLASIDSKMSPSTAAITTVAQNAASVSILASSGTRKGFIIENNSISIMFIAFGATATTAAGGYTRRLQPNSAYEPPLGVYTGAISAIWASAGAGFAEITSLS